ncbi:zinc ribbon domain-containing protein [Amphibacillus sp. Q70]|uniref:zinc ribbon domain-containing protein n=1 Tax=Amphibacillus sp. Q70 TaxID=3453416 RepID=UPI003F84E3A1
MKRKYRKTKKDTILTAEVYYTPAYQSYFSAGDESEAFCSNCDEYLEDGWNYCPMCGAKMFEYYDEFDDKEWGVGR